nr:phosphoribosylformylglycinamidine synthase subunit PurS [Oryzicola mucosus]
MGRPPDRPPRFAFKTYLRRPSSVIKARVIVTLKNGVLDPQGKAIEGALGGLGFDGVGSVRQGKVFDVELSSTDAANAEAEIKAMCDKLLANTVIENYSVTLI